MAHKPKEKALWTVTVGSEKHESYATSEGKAISNVRFREYKGYFPRMACVYAERRT